MAKASRINRTLDPELEVEDTTTCLVNDMNLKTTNYVVLLRGWTQGRGNK
jgi:hypothetical protein